MPFSYRTILVFPVLLLAMIFLQNCSKVNVTSSEVPKQSGPRLQRTDDNGEGNLNPPTYTCGGPGNAALYTPEVRLVKVQSAQRYASYADCQASRAAYFANAGVCSKMVSATLFGCLASKDFSYVTMEADFALPVFKANNQMEVPYDYYLLGVPNCELAKNFLNTFTGSTIVTSGNFTDGRADIRAECLTSTNVLIHVLRIY